MMSEYKLSASLEGHEDDVRGVAFPSSKLIVTASRDATVRLWKLLSSPPPNFDGSVASSGSAFINTVAFFPPSKEYSEGLIFAGGKDTIIEVREPSKPPDSHAERLLIGHSHAVCALDVSHEGGWVVSGSWDGTARIWPVGKWECEAVLEGHEGSVWGVLAYDKDTIITAAADKLIRVFNTQGKLLRKIEGHSDVVRALCRLPKGHPSGAHFASASNDGDIKLWSLDGSEVATLHGHENFIYSLAVLPSGELASTGEDRTLRIWKGTECIQTITHPAISVWAVAVCHENGDIVTGASDKKSRVFSRHPERHADAETIKSFEDAVKGSAIPQQQVGNINKEKLPGPEFLTQKMGKKDGQVTMIRENDGTIGAYSWSSSTHEWIQVGTVVDSAGSSGRKQTYNGKDYDYVFDVDIEDGKPPLKLAYNLSQNPYEAATKFVQDNELSMNYLDEVANFITRNTSGASIGQSSGDQTQPSGGADPWGQESRYRPGDASAQAPSQAPSQGYSAPPRPKSLPQKTYLSIKTANLNMIHRKIKELNASAEESSLDAKQAETLGSLIDQLQTVSGSGTLPATAVQPGLEIIVSLLKKWQSANRLPVLDLLRVISGSSEAVARYSSPATGESIVEVLAETAFSDKDRPNNIMLAMRVFANLFETEAGRLLADERFDPIHSLSKGFEAGTSNRNLAIAAATVCINYAVLTSTPDLRDRVDVFDRASACVETLIGILKTEKDSEAIYRALVGVGTWLMLSGEIREAAKEVYGLEAALKRAEGQAREPRIKSVSGEIRDLYR